MENYITVMQHNVNWRRH